MTKIIHIVPTDRLGGTERNALRMTEEGHARGLESEILIYKGTSQGYLVKNLSAKLINKKYLNEIVEESKRGKKIKIIIHFFGYHVLKLIITNFFLVRKNIVVVQGNSFSKGLKGIKQFVVLLSLKLMGVKLVAVSDYVRQSVIFSPFFSRLLTVVHNGMDVDSFSSSVKEKRNAGRGKKNNGLIFGMLSRLDPIKDHQTVLYAFKRYLEDNPERKCDSFVIAGEGELLDSLVQQVSDLDLKNKVEIKGIYETAEDFFARIDVFVFSTTENEGFGNVLVEAACAEVPILCSDIGPCREVLGDSGALYFKPKDVEHLRKMMEKVHSDWSVVTDMKSLSKRFSISTMLDRYLI